VILSMMAGSAMTQEAGSSFLVSPVWPNALRLQGMIDARSALSFRRVLAANPQAKVLVLDSPGGDVQNGLLIADDIYTRGMSTVVPKGSVCASACAYMFFAGRNRVVQGELGVHQISGSASLENAQLNISDILDTLNKYGVDQRIFPIMFRTSADDIHFFSSDEIKQYGIERLGPDMPVTVTAPTPSSSTPIIQSAPPSVNALQQEKSVATSFVAGLVNAGSLAPEQAIAFASSAYADEVEFYGKQETLAKILLDKRKFFDRWPIRNYQIRPGTVVVSCSDTLCRVDGEFDWQVLSPQRAKSLSGTASFFYSLNMNGQIKVIAEGGKARR
jgi:ATP-dependent protease ClpP protease subunit